MGWRLRFNLPIQNDLLKTKERNSVKKFSEQLKSRWSIMTEELRTYLNCKMETKWGLKTKQAHGHKRQRFWFNQGHTPFGQKRELSWDEIAQIFSRNLQLMNRCSRLLNNLNTHSRLNYLPRCKTKHSESLQEMWRHLRDSMNKLHGVICWLWCHISLRCICLVQTEVSISCC